MSKKVRFKYDQMFDKATYFDAPPLEFEVRNALENAKMGQHHNSILDLIEVIENDSTKNNKDKPYKGWQLISEAVLSKNYQKMNFLRNWRKIKNNINKKDNFPLLFLKKHKLTLKEQIRVYLNQRIGKLI